MLFLFEMSLNELLLNYISSYICVRIKINSFLLLFSSYYDFLWFLKWLNILDFRDSMNTLFIWYSRFKNIGLYLFLLNIPFFSFLNLLIKLCLMCSSIVLIVKPLALRTLFTQTGKIAWKYINLSCSLL